LICLVKAFVNIVQFLQLFIRILNRMRGERPLAVLCEPVFQPLPPCSGPPPSDPPLMAAPTGDLQGLDRLEEGCDVVCSCNAAHPLPTSPTPRRDVTGSSFSEVSRSSPNQASLVQMHGNRGCPSSDLFLVCCSWPVREH